MQIQNKTVLVTGASRGIGPYISRALADNGAHLILTARSQEGLEKTKSELSAKEKDLTILAADLRNASEIEDLVQKISHLNRGVDILINNAGLEKYQFFQDYNQKDIDDIINLNLKAPMELTRLLLPQMLENGGHIVNIASLAGKKGVPHNSIYSSTKAGLIMFTDSLRQELAGTKVGISVICPGFISEAGMFFNSGLSAPPLLGSSPPEKVSRAVVQAIQRNKGEIIVNNGPIKPLLALNQISPALGNKIVRLFGVKKITRKRVETGV